MLDRLAGTTLRLTAASLAIGFAAVAFDAADGGTGLIPPVLAQSAPGSPAGGRHMMAKMLMSLGLSDDQKARIRGIMSDVHKQNEAENADPETRRANYKAGIAKIDTVLTPGQRMKLHAELDRMRQAHGQGAQS